MTAFRAALLANDVEALARYFLGRAPGDTAALRRDHVDDVLCELPNSLTEAVPQLDVLRSIARVSCSGGSREEVPSQLQAATHRLLARGNVPWAAVAAAWWLRMMIFLVESSEAYERGRRLIGTHPELADQSPLVAAEVAGLASIVGADEAAELWQRALEHPLYGTDVDEYWYVKGTFARLELIPRRGQLAEGRKLLRRAREHLSGTSDDRMRGALVTICLNHAAVLILEGNSQEAVRQLDEDLERLAAYAELLPWLHAMRAWAAAQLGDVALAEVSLSECGGITRASSGMWLAAIGPARIELAAAAHDLHELRRVITELRQMESEACTVTEDRLLWRLLASRAMRELGEGETAADLAAHALQLARQSQAQPFFSCWAELVSADLADGSDTDIDPQMVAQAVHAGCVDALIHWEPSATLRALRRAAAGEAADPAFARNAREILASFGAGAESSLRRVVPSRVEVRLLGTFEVLLDGEPVPAAAWGGRRKAQLLLARLLLNPGVPQSREALIEDLWPDSDPQRSSSNLGALVYTIRRALQPNLEPRTTGEFLETSGSSYCLRLRAGDLCDVVEFERSARACLAAREPADALGHGDRALALYRGDFLASESVGSWIFDVRGQLESLWSSVVLHIAGVHLREGQADRSRDSLERLVQRDPANEAACRALMQIYAQSGDVVGASRLYHRTRAVLDSEFGLPPSRATRELFTALIG